MLIYLYCLLTCLPLFAQDKNNEIFDKLKTINQMREALAVTLDKKPQSEITADSFKEVCLPVGKELKRWGEEKGYLVRQISLKNRNPSNGLKSYDQKNYQKFLKDVSLNELTVLTDEKELKGTLHYTRIPVAQSCLHCHGEKDKRPQFIQSKYKDDKAYGFKPGELRGLYSVFVPKAKSLAQ